MKDNKGFTLVELLAALTILLLIALITVPAIDGIINKSSNKIEKAQIQELIEISKKYVSEYGLDFENGKYLLTLEELKKSEFLDDKEYNDFKENKLKAAILVRDGIDSYEYTWIGNYNIVDETSEESCFISTNGVINGFDGEKDGCQYDTTLEFPTSIDGVNIHTIEFNVDSEYSFYTERSNYVESWEFEFENLLYLETIKKGAFSNNSIGGEYDDNDDISIDLSNNYLLTTIEEEAFYINTPDTDIQDGPILKSVILPPNLKIIGEKAFAYSDIENLTLPDTLEFIGQQAFLSNRIKSLEIPKSVTSIGAHAFDENGMKELIIRGKKSTSDFMEFDDPFDVGNDDLIYKYIK